MIQAGLTNHVDFPRAIQGISPKTPVRLAVVSFLFFFAVRLGPLAVCHFFRPDKLYKLDNPAN